jgi:hypothetical protein
MGHVVHAAIVDLSLQHQKAVGIGIIGLGATLAQAEARREGYDKVRTECPLCGGTRNYGSHHQRTTGWHFEVPRPTLLRLIELP